MSNFNGDFNIIVSASLISFGQDAQLAIKYKHLEKTTLIITVFSPGFSVKLRRTLVSPYFQLHEMLCLSETIL